MSLTGRGAVASDAHGAADDFRPGTGRNDVALVVGTRFSAPAPPGAHVDEVKLVRIDIDPAQAQMPRQADGTVIAQASTALADLAERIPAHNKAAPPREGELRASKQAALDKMAEPQPQYGFAQVIRDALPEDGICVTDVTQMATFPQNPDAGSSPADDDHARLSSHAWSRASDRARCQGRLLRQEGLLHQWRRGLHVQRPGAFHRGRPQYRRDHHRL